jgi:[ribosomal protein S5]-alanine N-acetyltransferase
MHRIHGSGRLALLLFVLFPNSRGETLALPGGRSSGSPRAPVPDCLGAAAADADAGIPLASAADVPTNLTIVRRIGESRRCAQRRLGRRQPGRMDRTRNLDPVLDRLTLPPFPTLQGQRVILRGPRESDVEDRVREPIDPEEEDGYGSAWRRAWDGRRYHTREPLTCDRVPRDPSAYEWAIEHEGQCIGSTRLVVNRDQHSTTYAVGVFVAGLRGQGLGQEVTRLVLAWGFDVLGLHRIELQVLATNRRAVGCYLACGFRKEGVRREAELYPDGWKDFLLMGLLRSEYPPRVTTPRAADKEQD